MRGLLAVVVCVLVSIGAPTVAIAGDAGGATVAVADPSAGGEVVLAAADGGVPINQILELEPSHLVALGTGVVAGAVLIGPTLGVSELVGVFIGLIGGELMYRSEYWPFEKNEGWW